VTIIGTVRKTEGAFVFVAEVVEERRFPGQGEIMQFPSTRTAAPSSSRGTGRTARCRSADYQSLTFPPQSAGLSGGDARSGRRQRLYERITRRPETIGPMSQRGPSARAA